MAAPDIHENEIEHAARVLERVAIDRLNQEYPMARAIAGHGVPVGVSSVRARQHLILQGAIDEIGQANVTPAQQAFLKNGALFSADIIGDALRRAGDHPSPDAAERRLSSEIQDARSTFRFSDSSPPGSTHDAARDSIDRATEQRQRARQLIGDLHAGRSVDIAREQELFGADSPYLAVVAAAQAAGVGGADTDPMRSVQIYADAYGLAGNPEPEAIAAFREQYPPVEVPPTALEVSETLHESTPPVETAAITGQLVTPIPATPDVEGNAPDVSRRSAAFPRPQAESTGDISSSVDPHLATILKSIEQSGDIITFRNDYPFPGRSTYFIGGADLSELPRDQQTEMARYAAARRYIESGGEVIPAGFPKDPDAFKHMVETGQGASSARRPYMDAMKTYLETGDRAAALEQLNGVVCEKLGVEAPGNAPVSERRSPQASNVESSGSALGNTQVTGSDFSWMEDSGSGIRYSGTPLGQAFVAADNATVPLDNPPEVSPNSIEDASAPGRKPIQLLRV